MAIGAVTIHHCLSCIGRRSGRSVLSEESCGCREGAQGRREDGSVASSLGGRVCHQLSQHIPVSIRTNANISF
jgi:hypothetical protein